MTFEMNRINRNLRYSNFIGNGHVNADNMEYDIPKGNMFTNVACLQIKNTLLKDLSIPKEKIKVTVEWE